MIDKLFSELIGQETLVETLTNAIKLNRVSHAYLLTGVRGVGKTTLSRLFAQALNCESGVWPPQAHCGLRTRA